MTRIRRKRDLIEVSVSAADADVVASLGPQVAAMLRTEDPAQAVDPLEAMVGMSTEAVPPPDDPALQRLLPDAYADDTLAGEFRRLTDGELRQTKSAALEALVHDIAGEGPVRLTAERAETWLQALNDIRLVLGVRLDVREDMAEIVDSLTPGDPRLPLMFAYERLTWLQDALIEALDAAGR